MALQFFDETGVNPLPAGILVTVFQTKAAITSPAQIVGNFGVLVGSASTQAGGICKVPVQTAVSYVAAFGQSGQAPGFGSSASLPFVAFVGSSSNPTVITVPGYRSPTLSTTGYAQGQAALWPKLWFTKAASTPGGNAYAVAVMLAAIYGQADALGEIIHGALRAQSCVGSELDTWAYDFLGGYLPRLQTESDASYYARILIALQAPKTTLAEIQVMVEAFYAAISGGFSLTTGGGQQLDIAGGLDVLGGIDVTQGFGSNPPPVPTVYVWDRQSRPDLADQYNVNPSNNDGSFVIQLGELLTQAWFLDNSFLDDNAFLISPGSYTLSSTPPDPRLGALVNFIKAGGSEPLYLISSTLE